ncbi:MAG TPA: Dabb family protein [Stellaceae bacterium]|nr:Dabb family protein [Stellaceae bacterium]
MISTPRDPVLVHVLLVSFRAAATAEQRDWVYSACQTLAERCGGRDAGILHWQVDWNLDQRKNWHLVELAVFSDDAALRAFRTHPAHAEMSGVLREIADWAVGDILSTLLP